MNILVLDESFTALTAICWNLFQRMTWAYNKNSWCAAQRKPSLATTCCNFTAALQVSFLKKVWFQESIFIFGGRIRVRKKSLQNILLYIAKVINPRVKSQARGQNNRSRALKWGIVHLCNLNGFGDMIKNIICIILTFYNLA